MMQRNRITGIVTTAIVTREITVITAVESFCDVCAGSLVGCGMKCVEGIVWMMEDRSGNCNMGVSVGLTVVVEGTVESIWKMEERNCEVDVGAGLAVRVGLAGCDEVVSSLGHRSVTSG